MAQGAATAGAYKSVYRLIQSMVGLSENVPVKYRRWLWEKDSPADDRLAGREAFEDLHPGAVGRAQFDFPFDVCFRIELHENRVDACGII